jgi:hypothetical protein
MSSLRFGVKQLRGVARSGNVLCLDPDAALAVGDSRRVALPVRRERRNVSERAMYSS